jgi:endogenous inhibitor of DNA gyrase (YacG/DUF329 family)
MQKFKRKCPVCGKEFETKNTKKIYCSQSCNFKSWDKKNPRVRKEEKK